MKPQTTLEDTKMIKQNRETRNRLININDHGSAQKISSFIHHSAIISCRLTFRSELPFFPLHISLSREVGEKKSFPYLSVDAT
jgi:hypothetical protein